MSERRTPAVAFCLLNISVAVSRGDAASDYADWLVIQEHATQVILARISELAEIKNNPLQPFSFFKTWEEFAPAGGALPGRALQQIGLKDVSECCDGM